MDKGRRTIIVLALSVLAILLIVCHIVTDRNTTSAQEAWLDAEELHYDANGPFILIDKETAQLGYYAATAPVWHMHDGRTSPRMRGCGNWKQITRTVAILRISTGRTSAGGRVRED